MLEVYYLAINIAAKSFKIGDLEAFKSLFQSTLTVSINTNLSGINLTKGSSKNVHFAQWIIIFINIPPSQIGCSGPIFY